MISENADRLLDSMSSHLYLPPKLVDGGARPCVDTQFFVDHSHVPEMVKAASTKGRPWRLGGLEEGEEWFACTFHSQTAEPLSKERLEELIAGGGDGWVRAYERMSLDEGHAWRRHTNHEVSAVLALSGMPRPRILDVGCGDGRHSIELARRGYQVTAIDISDALVGSAGIGTDEFDLVNWQTRDARDDLFDSEFDLAICLYDVVGSTGNEQDDADLLINIHDSLVVGGCLVLGVMNAEAIVLPVGHRPSNAEEFAAAWEELPASTTMHRTGAVFDPDLLLLYDGVHFRKEQFPAAPGELPTEQRVRDKRYTAREISALLEGIGFEVDRAAPVTLGDWTQTSGPAPRIGRKSWW